MKRKTNIWEQIFWNIFKGTGVGILGASNFFDIDEAIDKSKANHDIPGIVAGYALKGGQMVGDAVVGMATMDVVAAIDGHANGYDINELDENGYDDPDID